MVDKEELEKLREQKMQEISEEDKEKQQEHIKQRKQTLWNQATQYMTSEARSRLSNIKTVNEQKAMAVAQQIKALGDSGQIKTVDEETMKQILKSVNQDKKEQNIKFRR